MTSIAIENIYKSHKLNYNRLETDKFFALPFGSISMKGRLDDAIRFVEGFQLLDAPLWKRFANQFATSLPKADDADNGWRGEYWGKMMRGACFVYQYTQNPELYAVLEATVRNMLTNADEFGRISSYSVLAQYNGWDMWCRKYVMLGMEYFIEICKDEDLIKQITKSLCAQANYMIDTIGYESEGKVLITKTSGHWKGMNSSSILEPIVRLYNLTREQKYLDFATYIVDCGVISDEDVSIFELAYKNELELHDYPVTKAYEMMSCFEGLLEYYRVTRIEKWRDAVINFGARVRASEISVIGSAGCTHELFDNTKVSQTGTVYNGMLQETCVTVTWMKFCFQLLQLTGDVAYADEIEKSAYNAYLGAINYDKRAENGGLPFDSYSPLLFNNRAIGIGGHKIMADGSYYGCCACIGSAGVGLIGLSAALLTDSGIVINTYTNLSIKTKTPSGELLKLKISTDYPVKDTINIEFTSDINEECSVFVRIPSWSIKSFACINGQALDVTAGQYAEFRKAFKKGDYITLKLDMRAKLIYALPNPDDENSVYHVAIKRGPLMLARDSQLPGDIEDTVKITPDAEGYVECIFEKNHKFGSAYLFNVKAADNINIPMIDYASAGRTWDDNSIVSVWLPTKNYWAVDILKPVSIFAPNMWDMSANRYPLIIGDDGLLQIGKENGEGEKFFFWAVGENKYAIKALTKGKYLAIADDGKHITLSDSSKEFKLIKHAQNRYHLAYNDSELCISGLEDPHVTLAAPTCEACHVFRFENQHE